MGGSAPRGGGGPRLPRGALGGHRLGGYGWGGAAGGEGFPTFEPYTGAHDAAPPLMLEKHIEKHIEVASAAAETAAAAETSCAPTPPIIALPNKGGCGGVSPELMSPGTPVAITPSLPMPSLPMPVPIPQAMPSQHAAAAFRAGGAGQQQLDLAPATCPDAWPTPGAAKPGGSDGGKGQ